MGIGFNRSGLLKIKGKTMDLKKTRISHITIESLIGSEKKECIDEMLKLANDNNCNVTLLLKTTEYSIDIGDLYMSVYNPPVVENKTK